MFSQHWRLLRKKVKKKNSAKTKLLENKETKNRQSFYFLIPILAFMFHILPFYLLSNIRMELELTRI